MTPPTAAALGRRTDRVTPDQTAFADVAPILDAVAARLIPHDVPGLDLGHELRRRMVAGTAIGWRHADMPDDATLFELGLAALNATAHKILGREFAGLDEEQQDEILRAIQFNRVSGPEWEGIRPDRFFDELLATLVDIFYAQPGALDEIGYAGFADARGWQAVELEARAAHEPERPA
ncbi:MULTISPECIES: gluconate 2-dehydrogenase subunit 3 family protein [Sphingosinicellaceae]|uniref:gluconate 2-dehydrogenase subunit 3 family protein n=1 Tax=Sphingosinicellaceae TaxID=2820280 RepID=UPI001C1E6507|nr:MULTISPECIES: gluconate 2-dehydrogenase subunit 3 family protein [Polymorphobacter]QYE35678.1 gluconate 2-dehydrogenase subunit 3 family protein [Polymorphobacter sp. PAMC 29334]UAJ10954.1 gluconate 2-dehydrogenase subunit 3 family protein [Polymorphobacter megasporae]